MSQARIAEYEGSDLHERIALQRELDRDRPLRDALFPHTHNSFDMRAIEIDIHRAPSLTEGKVGVVACHAQEGGGTLVHPGCTNEEPLSFYLAQLRSWLDANPTQFVILWLSVMVDPDGEGGGITTSEMSDMVRCGVNLVGFDMLHPNDPRLRTLVWTWAPDEPSAPGCALQVGDGHWVSRSCGEQHRAACFAGGEWTVTADPVTYADAAAACAFDRPWNGWENSRLLDVSGGDVWVAWSDVEVAPQ